jgi:t-SNARE complex subunit (syntaxin)
MVTVNSVLAEAQKIIGQPVATSQPVVATTGTNATFKTYLPYIIGIIIFGIIVYFISKHKK